MTAKRTGWVRIGTDTTWVMVAVGVGLSALGAGLIAAPLTELVEQTSGARPGWWATAMWTFLVLALLIAVPLAVFANRPAHVNLKDRLLRVAWRTVPFTELRHVYRMPGGTTPDEFVIQLELRGGLDARLPVRSASLPNLSAEDLEALLEMLEYAPVEPNPDFPLRSPLADELGDRADADWIADKVSDALQPFGRVSYAKPTLLLEVQDALARLHRAAGGDDTVGDALPSERMSAAAKVLGALQRGPAPTMTIMPTPMERTVDTARGKFSTRRKATEEWLSGAGAHVNTHTLSRVMGWVLVGLFLALPWATSLTLFKGMFAFIVLPSDVTMGWWAASLLTWPLGVWLGVIVLLRARALRHRSGRRGALAVRSRGYTIPESVQDFFAATKHERWYGTQVYIFGIVLFIAFLASGLVLLALGADTVGGPYAPLSWHTPVGWLLLTPAIPVFVGVLRWQKYMYGQLARAHVEWRLLGNSSA